MDILGAKVRTGSCAWSFEDWRGVFYPEHLGANHWLEFYSHFFDSVEIDSTFYAIPRPGVAAHWLEVTPDNFVFSVKLPRAITHERKLHDSALLMKEFLCAIEPLLPKLGAILVQLPPYFTLKYDEPVLREFIHHLPREFRFAIEFRDPSWHMPRITHLLEQAGICWVWADATSLELASQGAFELLPRTTDFLYIRLLGDLTTKYRGDGSRVHRYKGLLWPRGGSLESWTMRIQQHQNQIARAFVYANNHFEGFAPHTVQRIALCFGKTITLPGPEELAPPKEPDDPQLELL